MSQAFDERGVQGISFERKNTFKRDSPVNCTDWHSNYCIKAFVCLPWGGFKAMHTEVFAEVRRPTRAHLRLNLVISAASRGIDFILTRAKTAKKGSESEKKKKPS